MVPTTRGSSRGKQRIDQTPGVIFLSSENVGRRTRKNRGEGGRLIINVEDSHTPKRVITTRSVTKKRKEIFNVSDASTGGQKKRRGVQQTETPSLKTRCSPKQLYNAISVLSERQQEAVKQMGLGGLLGFVVDAIPEKLAFHVVDKFDARKLTLSLGSTQLVVTSTLISQLLGIREGSKNFSTIEPFKHLHPSLKGWRARYPPGFYISPTLISTEIQEDNYDDMMFFHVDFMLLFLTTMASSQMNGYVKDKILKRLTADTQFSALSS